MYEHNIDLASAMWLARNDVSDFGCGGHTKPW